MAASSIGAADRDEPPPPTKTPTRRPSGAARTDLLAGFAVSAAYVTATYPLHRIKVLLQTQHGNARVSTAGGTTPAFSFISAFRRVAREQGPAALWRGAAPYLARHVPSVALSFAGKDALRARLPAVPDARAAPWAALAANAAAGAGAGAAALALVYPFEFAAVRMAADVGGARPVDRQFGVGIRDAWRLAARRDARGLGALYRGFGVAVGSIACYKALYFGLYDSAKQLLHGDADAPLTLAPGPLAARAALAGATTLVAASATYPLDIVRKRLIIAIGGADDERAAAALAGGGKKQPQPLRVMLSSVVAGIWTREGFKGFYRFWGVDMLFRVGGGALLVGYDALRHGQRRERNSGSGDSGG